MQVVQSVIKVLREKDILTQPEVPKVVPQLPQFKFKQYEDSIFASYARAVSKKNPILVKRKNPEISCEDDDTSKRNMDASKKHEKFNVKFKFNDTFDVNERSFEVVLRNLLVCFQAKDCAERQLNNGKPAKK